MKEIKGYVFVADFGDLSRIFGPRVNQKLPYDFENFESNGLVPYETLEDATNQAALYGKTMSGVLSTRAGNLEMVVVDVPEKVLLMDEEELVIVQHHDFGHNLYGLAKNTGTKTPAEMSLLSQNGIKPFTRVEYAERSVHDVVSGFLHKEPLLGTYNEVASFKINYRFQLHRNV